MPRLKAALASLLAEDAQNLLMATYLPSTLKNADELTVHASPRLS